MEKIKSISDFQQYCASDQFMLIIEKYLAFVREKLESVLIGKYM